MPSAEQAIASVLDASALLALIHDENGAAVVAEAIEHGAAISVANWIEVLSTLAERGKDPEQAAAELRAAEGEQTVLALEPITDADCIAIARLRPVTKPLGLSLADRACLVLAARLGVPALTADRAWKDASVDVAVRLIR